MRVWRGRKGVGLALWLAMPLSMLPGVRGMEWTPEVFARARKNLEDKLAVAYPDMPQEIRSHFRLAKSRAVTTVDEGLSNYLVEYRYDGVNGLNVWVLLDGGTEAILDRSEWQMEPIAAYQQGITLTEAERILRGLYAAELPGLLAEYAEDYRLFTARYGEAATQPEQMTLRHEFLWEGAENGEAPAFLLAAYGPENAAPWLAALIDAGSGRLESWSAIAPFSVPPPALAEDAFVLMPRDEEPALLEQEYEQWGSQP